MTYMERLDAICAEIEAEGLAVTLEVQQIVEIALRVTERMRAVELLKSAKP